MRRRPIPRTAFKPPNSLRYSTDSTGAFRTYPDGRQVCCENAAGHREYLRRLQIMVQRQNFRCGACQRRLALFQATFDHWPIKRRMGAAFRDDRITDAEGNWINRAVHWACQNPKKEVGSEKG